MAQVTVTINQRDYRMACEDGQEHHLLMLGERFNQYVEKLRKEFGEIGDTRLAVMGGIMALDQIVELERQLKVSRLRLEDSQKYESQAARSLLDAAQKLEAVMAEFHESSTDAVQEGEAQEETTD